MTPAARFGAAIDVLDDIDRGAAVEQALTRWARASRYAGSKDRAAVRDIVFDVIRRKASCAWCGQGTSGRALVLGLLRLDGQDPAQVFGAGGHAPGPLGASEQSPAPSISDAPRDVQMNMPEPLLALFDTSLGPDADAVLRLLSQRAPIGLRVNTRKTDVATAHQALQNAGYTVDRHPVADTALVLPAGARGLQNHDLFQSGAVELQDPGSQALVARLPLADGQKVLDYCAGGGGKTLAALAAARIDIVAHDADPKRMSHLPQRAARAGEVVTVVDQNDLKGQFDGIICDVPCSGSGAWRRSPAAKWVFDLDRLQQLQNVQRTIVSEALPRLKPGGWLAYMTCSLFKDENEDQVAQILGRHPDLSCVDQWATTPLNDTDGFFLALFQRS